MALDFLNDATTAILVGPNGVGKSTLARNIAHQALIRGHTVLFISAGQLLGDLAALDSDSALRRRLPRHDRECEPAGARLHRRPASGGGRHRGHCPLHQGCSGSRREA
jgi:signal recognition particle GTPase